MFVESPLSCIMFVVGAPTRDLLSFSLESNARHSGPRSISSSSTTSPQSTQTVSPCSVSVASWPPHSGHRSSSASFSDSVSLSSSTSSVVYVRRFSLIGLVRGGNNETERRFSVFSSPSGK
ncbi:hypothetical protein C466_11546 [Halorubrum distributum JCM 10118]|uniref:Uncharacterized protein n=1 Tax=Halorubrum distributum JCM 10118 TaxID=1227468 RepID=M0EZA2_9EURY|nr:hypothetical protein C466_11546 [Halorubrum distributum JCM 10118]